MPDLAESSLEFFDQPVYDEYLASVGEAQLDLVGQVSTGSTGDATIPVVSAVTPTPGTEITRETPIGFQITDAGGNLESTNVFVFYPSLQRFEVLFFAAISGAWGTRPEGFGPQYTGTRTPITNGFAFTGVIRRGGWPARPVVVIDPTDTTGNEVP